MASSRRFPFFYGWVIAGVCFLTIFFSEGLRLIFSVFYVAMLEEFSWPRAGGVGPFALAMVVLNAALPAMGVLVDRWGPRKIMPLMVALTGLGLAGCSLIQKLWHFYILFGVIIATGLAATWIPLQAALVSRWFRRRRGLAIGIALSGGGLGGLALSPLTQHLIGTLGWRAAFLAVAAGFLFLLLPLLLLFLRAGPEELGLGPDGGPLEGPPPVAGQASAPEPARWTLRAALKTSPFWLVFLVGAFHSYALNFSYAHTVIYLVDSGFSPMLAATAWGGVGVTMTLSYFLWGGLSDRVGRDRAHAGGTACFLIALFILFVLKREPSPALLYLFVPTAGFAIGSRPGLLAAMAADLSAGKQSAAIIGAAMSGLAVGGSIGPWTGGYIFDLTGTYDPALVVAGVTSVLASVFAFLAMRRKKPPA